jgi:hypothetical protein
MTWLSGADEEVLAAFPGDRPRFTALSAVMITTGVLATVSMWFFLHMALRFNGVAVVPFALLWGAGIMSIDRMLIVSMRSHTWWIILLQATPRFVVALLLGIVISTPVTLQIFSSEINNEIKVIQSENAGKFAAGVQSNVAQEDKQYEQSTTGGAQITSLKQALTTAQGTLATDEQRLQKDKKQQATDFSAWQCQLYGGSGCTQDPPGDGPVAKQDYARYEADVQNASTDTKNVDEATSEVAAATKTLNSATTAAGNDYNALATKAQSQADVEIAAYDSQNPQDAGILIRLQALDQLAGGIELAVARWALFALFTAFEILPVLTKTLQQFGQVSAYEKGLDVADAERLKAFKEALTQANGQVVTQIAAAHVQATQAAMQPSGGGNPATSRLRRSRGTRPPRAGRTSNTPPSGTPAFRTPTSGHPVPGLTGPVLQQYQPPPVPPTKNGHAAGPGTP